MYESEEQQGQGRLMDVQKELAMLQNKLSHVEASRASLEASLKEETSARSQLVSQLFALRKVCYGMTAYGILCFLYYWIVCILFSKRSLRCSVVKLIFKFQLLSLDHSSKFYYQVFLVHQGSFTYPPLQSCLTYIDNLHNSIFYFHRFLVHQDSFTYLGSSI